MKNSSAPHLRPSPFLRYTNDYSLKSHRKWRPRHWDCFLTIVIPLRQAEKLDITGIADCNEIICTQLVYNHQMRGKKQTLLIIKEGITQILYAWPMSRRQSEVVLENDIASLAQVTLSGCKLLCKSSLALHGFK